MSGLTYLLQNPGVVLNLMGAHLYMTVLTLAC